MKYLGAKFTITVGTLRLRYVLSLEDAGDSAPDNQIRAVPDIHRRLILQRQDVATRQ